MILGHVDPGTLRHYCRTHSLEFFLIKNPPGTSLDVDNIANIQKVFDSRWCHWIWLEFDVVEFEL